MTVAELIFMLKYLEQDKIIYFANEFTGRLEEAKSVYKIQGKWTILGIDEASDLLGEKVAI